MASARYTFLKALILLVIFSLFENTVGLAQSEFLPEKQGSLIYQVVNYNNQTPSVEISNHQKNVKALVDYLVQNAPVMKANKGFDLHIYHSANDKVNEKTGKRILKSYQYGMTSEVRFLFELFIKNGKKWTVEPPGWSFDINETETGGHGGMYNDGNPNDYFLVFPFVKEIAPGVHYYNCEAQTCGQIVVFNPNRPKYWLPVTAREVVQAKLKFYNTDKESDKAIYEYIKPLVDALSDEELNAPAFYGSEDAILNVNGKGQGLQIMRFNPDYWDRSLPASAIQYFTISYNEFAYNCFNEDDVRRAKEEYFKNNGHIEYHQEIPHSLNLAKLADFIQKK